MVLAGSGRISPVPPYSGHRPGLQSFRVRGSHPLRPRFPNAFHFARRPFRRPYNPARHAGRFGLVRFRSPLLAESLFCSPFLRVLRCFSSPGRCTGTRPARWRFTPAGCPIRTPADQWSFAPPRSFSQLTASFVIPGSQGIPHAPFHASLPCVRPGRTSLLVRTAAARRAHSRAPYFCFRNRFSLPVVSKNFCPVVPPGTWAWGQGGLEPHNRPPSGLPLTLSRPKKTPFKQGEAVQKTRPGRRA